MSGTPRLELLGIEKRFGSVQALRGADFSLAHGEVHALLGENGAGKSTLMHIAYGMFQPDAGAIRVDGRLVALRSPRDARAHGLGMVHQHFTSIGALTVRENVELVSNRRSGERAEDNALSAGLPPEALTESLPVALRQRLEIVKALATGASILLLDEPSAVLAPPEVDELLALVRGFVGGGGAAVLITHKLREVLAVADRVTVLRQGRVTLEGPVAGETATSLAQAMIGAGDGGGAYPEIMTRHQSKVVGPSAPGNRADRGHPALSLGNQPIYPGEITGVAAVVGNGQRELLRAHLHEGGIAFIPEDRSTEGLIGALTVTENMVLGLLDDSRWCRGLRLNWPAARSRTAELLTSFDITAGGPDALVRTLSGGNQQKVILARALERRPRVLIAENPTRGLDVRAIADVHARLRGAAADGVAVLVYSTDLDEVLDLADRLLVVHAGEVRTVPTGTDRQVIGEMMLGVTGFGGTR